MKIFRLNGSSQRKRLVAEKLQLYSTNSKIYDVPMLTSKVTALGEISHGSG